MLFGKTPWESLLNSGLRKDHELALIFTGADRTVV